jgi:hypothetical protein
MQAGREGIMIDTRQFEQEVTAFVNQMKNTCDKEKYAIINNYLFKASEPMERMAKALAPQGKVKHSYKSKTGQTYTFQPGTLKRAIKRRKLGMNKGRGNPAIRITSLSRNKMLSAYYGGMVNVGHVAGKARVKIEGKEFYDTAMKTGERQFMEDFSNLMANHISRGIK